MRCALLTLAAAALVAAAGAAAAEPLVLLPSPVRGPTGNPPLRSDALIGEVRWRGGIDSEERIEVGLDATGRATTVDVVQRLVVGGVGDYVLAVPGPVVDVQRAPGSDADPGLRSGAVLWQGFSAGRERLAARIELAPAQTTPFLPVRVHVTREGGRVTVRVENVTGYDVDLPAGVGRPAELQAILRAVRRGSVGDVFAHLAGPAGSRTVRIEAPLRVTGEVRVGATRAVPIAAFLGAGRPVALTVAVRGSGDARVRLVVHPELPGRLLDLPPGLDGTRALNHTVETLARAARVHQYLLFLANPDAHGRNDAVYVFRTAAARPAVASAPPSEDGLGALGYVLIGLGAAAALVGGAVLWARS